jgi:DNA-binding transcriptional ArsR family regulator
MFTAIAVPTRRQILEVIASHGQLSAGDISHRFSVSAAAISQHLKVLREAKLVDMKKQAQKRLYHVNPAAIQELEIWIKQMTKQWSERFDRLDHVLLIESAGVRRKGKSDGRSTQGDCY